MRKEIHDAPVAPWTGEPLPFPSAASFSETAFEQFDQVIDQMDARFKKYYFIARESIPDIVATESNPTLFLLRSNGDTTKAATMMAHYWMNRNYFFGERWLLPMTQTGTGCLSREDVEMLRSGYISLVTFPDGRQVIISDASRLQNKSCSFVRERLIYYIITSALTERSQREGCDNVVLVTPKGLIDEGTFNENLRRLYTSLPFKINSMISLPLCLEEGRERLAEYFSFVVSRTHENYLSSSTVVDLSEISSLEQAIQNLEIRGIPRWCLPEKVGGAPGFDTKFAEWIRMRLSVEDAMSSALPVRNLLPALPAERPDRSDKGLSQIVRRPTGSKFSDSQDIKEFRRERNAMYGRRRTQRIKLQQLALQDQVDSLKDQNEKLRNANAELELVLKHAKLLVQTATKAANPIYCGRGNEQGSMTPSISCAGATLSPTPMANTSFCHGQPVDWNPFFYG